MRSENIVGRTCIFTDVGSQTNRRISIDICEKYSKVRHAGVVGNNYIYSSVRVKDQSDCGMRMSLITFGTQQQ